MAKAIKPGTNSLLFPNLSELKGNNLIPAILVLLYMLVEFIPRLGAIDVMGPQWLYLSIINAAAIGYILFDNKSNFAKAINAVSNSLLTLIYLLFFIVAGLSIIAAADKIESLCVYSRVVTTILMYLNIAILLYGRLNVLKFLAQAISIILLVKSLLIFGQFFSGVRKGELIDNIVLGITLNAGHKNILAASIVIQLPFLAYNIHKVKIWGKVLSVLISILAIGSLMVLNTRSVFVALLLQLFIYAAYSFVKFAKLKAWRKTILNIAGIAVLFFTVILLSNFLLKKAASKNDPLSYGTFAKRLSSIEFSDRGSSNRFWLWHNAAAYIESNPLLGCGIGNWKITSIPYERNFLNGLLVAYHAHNDFLETTAETGIPGGILFLSIFAALLWQLIKTYRHKGNEQAAELVPFILMAVGCYLIDASLNFPSERPVMQFYFAFIFAIGVNLYLAGGRKLPAQTEKISVKKGWLAGISVAFLVPAIVLQAMNYYSMIGQAKFSLDVAALAPKANWDEVKDAFPPIPDINAFCMPIDELKARYLIKDNKYDEAFLLLDKNRNINPALGYNDYLRGLIYARENKPDSARYYARSAFTKRTRELTYYVLLFNTCSKMRDSATINDIFNTEAGLRNEQWLWNDYIAAMEEFNVDKKRLLALTNTALNLFPGNAALLQKKEYLERNDDVFNECLASSKKAVEQKNFQSAIDYLKKASSLHPADYTVYENMGMCYFFSKDFKKAILLYHKAISLRNANDGKSEFYIGLSNIGLGNKAEACKYLQMADENHYPYAKANIATFCK